MPPRVTRSIVSGLAVVAVFGASSPATAAPYDVTGTAVRGDFDGDGSPEVAVSSPEHDCAKGAVFVREGSSTATWTRTTSGVLGTAACDDWFGAALAVGDINGDDYDDLVIGAPGADDAVSAGGAIHVLFGSSTGLTATGDQLIHQDSSGIQGTAETEDNFGEVLALGDFDCDGYDDVAVGVPGEAISSGADAGATHVIYGDSAGLTTTNDLYYQGNGGVDGAYESGDRFGAALAVGNFNGDSSGGLDCDDLAIASPDEAVGSLASAGYVYTIEGASTGLSTTGDLAFHQDTSGVVDTAEQNDRFGARLFAGDENDDGYADLAVVTPGDTCLTGHGVGVHIFRGASTGIVFADDHLECDLYRCRIGDGSTYGCHSFSPPVYASASADVITMFVGDDLVFAGAGNDDVTADLGDDTVFGGVGNDRIDGGGGTDMLIGGGGNDTFVIDLDCAVAAGEVVDGGPGTDVVESHLSQSALIAAGVNFASIESFTTITEGTGTCDLPAYEEGPFSRPMVALAWDDLPDAESIFTTSGSTLDLVLTNVGSVSASVVVLFVLNVQGYPAEITTNAITVGAGASTTYSLDLSDFIPFGFDPEDVDAALLDLPTSARLWTRATISVSGNEVGRSFAPMLYGHLEDAGATAVVYRVGAYHSVYYSGDLDGWREQSRGYLGNERLQGHIEARLVALPE